jgi:protein phosphatase
LQASGCLYVLADGVGGAARGERASQYAADKVVFEYFEHTEVDPAERLRQAIAGASADIFSYATDSARVTRMATTIVAAVVRENTLLVANVGDSRAYLIRGGQAVQLTRDHSVVGELVMDGEMTEEEAMASKIKNRLTRSVGGEPEVHVQVYDPLPIQQGDRLLLCSDGLTRYANRQKIAELVSQLAPDDIANRCIAFANSRGGADNVSVIAVSVGAPLVGGLPLVASTGRPHMPGRDLLEDAPTDPSAVVGAPHPRARRRPMSPGRRSRAYFVISAAIIAASLVITALLKWGPDVVLQPGLSPATESIPTASLPTVVPSPAVSAAPAATVTSTPGTSPGDELPKVQIKNRAVQLRTFPSTEDTYNTKVVHAVGEELSVLGQTASGEWLWVRAPNEDTGWLALEWVDKLGHWTNAPVLTPTAPPASVAGTAVSPAGGLCTAQVSQASDGLLGTLLQLFNLTYDATRTYYRCSSGNSPGDCAQPDKVTKNLQGNPEVGPLNWIVIPDVGKDRCLLQPEAQWLEGLTAP